MKRRTLLGAGLLVVAAPPFPIRAQEPARQRLIGLLINTAQTDQLGRAQRDGLVEGLKERGWVEGRNLRIADRWVGNDVTRYPKYAEEIVRLAPEVIVVGGGTNMVRPLQQATSTIPIVFTTATDPVGGGLVASLARPGGNITGLMQREFGLGVKSLELLKQLVPYATRVAVVRDPASTGGVGQFGAIQAAAQSFKVEISPIDVRTAAAIEQGIVSFASTPNGGLIVTSSTSAGVHRKLIINLANKHRLPAVFANTFYVVEGGLSAYGVDTVQAYRNGAAYVDRILRGERPADLPVQQPSKYELLLNLKTARAIGLTVPQAVLLRADKVFE